MSLSPTRHRGPRQRSWGPRVSNQAHTLHSCQQRWGRGTGHSPRPSLNEGQDSVPRGYQPWLLSMAGGGHRGEEPAHILLAKESRCAGMDRALPGPCSTRSAWGRACPPCSPLSAGEKALLREWWAQQGRCPRDCYQRACWFPVPGPANGQVGRTQHRHCKVGQGSRTRPQRWNPAQPDQVAHEGGG